MLCVCLIGAVDVGMSLIVDWSLSGQFGTYNVSAVLKPVLAGPACITVAVCAFVERPVVCG